MIYYNKGTKCLIRLCVSLFSLRKVYIGPITLLQEGGLEKWVVDYLIKIKVDVIQIPEDDTPPLARKAQLWRYTPYYRSMFLDADTVVLNDIMEYFDLIGKYEFVAGNFSNWKTTENPIRDRITVWSKVVSQEYVDTALAYGNEKNWGGAVNTGVFGFCRDAKILEEFESLTKKGSDANVIWIPDELACQILLPRYPHIMVSDQWGASMKFSKIDDNTKIIHYHGRKHTGDRESNYYWKRNYWELRHSGLISVDGISHSHGDRSFKNYMQGIEKKNKLYTFVTAVNERYFEKFRENWSKWMITEGLMDSDFVVIVKGIQRERLSFLHSGVKIIEWEMKNAKSEREEMLNAFVFGVIGKIETPFWFKIDCDTKPKGKKFTVYKEFFDFDIVGHKCGYTRTKEDGATKHFLNTLDDWWKEKTNEEPLFPPNIPINERYGHKRVASFIQLHRTSFIEEVAKICKNKLPIPSQDTVTWYVAYRLGKKILRCNFKNEMQP